MDMVRPCDNNLKSDCMVSGKNKRKDENINFYGWSILPHFGRFVKRCIKECMLLISIVLTDWFSGMFLFLLSRLSHNNDFLLYVSKPRKCYLTRLLFTIFPFWGKINWKMVGPRQTPRYMYFFLLYLTEIATVDYWATENLYNNSTE